MRLLTYASVTGQVPRGLMYDSPTSIVCPNAPVTFSTSL